MPELKLGKLPNRNRTKLTLDLPAELDDQLRFYANLYAELYGETVSTADIAPFMLADYLIADREFQKAFRAAKPAGG